MRINWKSRKHKSGKVLHDLEKGETLVKEELLEKECMKLLSMVLRQLKKKKNKNNTLASKFTQTISFSNFLELILLN